MTTDLKNVKIQSQNTFAGVSETADNTLYFVEAVVVTDTYHSGTEWRRTWSDGWCEQGGQTNSIPRNVTVVVQLPQAYVNSNYTISITNIGSYSNSNSSTPTITARANGSFSIINGCSTEQSFMWETKGYIS